MPTLLQKAHIFSWDFFLALYNAVTPKLRIGTVVPHGSPGAGRKWPEYVPPKEGDSRSACPALNAMANHGILPHDGKNIKFTEMETAVRATYNFAPTFVHFTVIFMAELLHRNYRKDTCDLADISLHNGIEHDASLTRQDFKFEPDQGKPYLPFIDELLASATGKDEEGNPMLTVADLSRYSSKRRTEARATNPDFTLDATHKMFGSSNTAGLLRLFGGKVADLEHWLKEERFPEGWETKARSRMGLTFLDFNFTVFAVERGIKEGTVPVREEEATLLPEDH